MKLPAFALERFFSRREFAAPYNLCASDCESITIAELLALEAGAAERFAELRLGYTQPAGDPDLRAAIASLYADIDPEQVYVHAGGEEVIFTFMNASLTVGDHVVVHHPSYQSLAEVPRAIGCEVTPWQGTAEDGWHLDLDRLRASIRPGTRAIVVNLPHSPTGFHMSRSEWDELLDVARRAGVILFSDEAYRGIEFAPGDRLPAACDLYDDACSVGMLSKGHGLPGLRIAWLATRNRSLLAEIARIKDYTTICSSAPSEFLATIALRHSEELLARSRELVIRNRGLLGSFLERHPSRFDWVPPRAGSVAFPTYLGAEGVDEFCRRCLDRAGVLLLPGTVFDPASRQFRVGLGRADVEASLNRLEASLGS